MRISIAVLWLGLLLLGGMLPCQAQENNSLVDRITVDIGYGLPTYYGDFFKRFNQVKPYRGSQELSGISQYNAQHFTGSMTIPFSKLLALRLQLSQTIFYYSEDLAQLYFKNHIFNFSVMPQLYVVNRDFGAYIFAGPGINMHRDPQTQDPDNLPSNKETLGLISYNKNVNRVSVSGGLGVQYHIFDWLTVYAESELMLTGSDRVDGYNGPPVNDSNQPDEKPFFQRDKIFTYRGGLRFRLIQPTKPVAERSEDNPVSSFVPDPELTDENLMTSQADSAREMGLTPEEMDLGVVREMDGYSLVVNHVMDLNELEKQKSVAQKIAAQVSGPDLEIDVYLKKESYGYSIHLGYFSSYTQAKENKRRVERYYAGVKIRRN